MCSAGSRTAAAATAAASLPTRRVEPLKVAVTSHHDYAVTSTRALLERLRTRAGLSVARLQASRLPLDPLLELEAVKRLQRSHGHSPERAIVEVTRDAAKRLQATDRIIVDVVLCLGLLRDRVKTTGQSLDSDLYADDLGRRRDSLVKHWRELHELVGASLPPSTPTVRALRSSIEQTALTALATEIVGSLREAFTEQRRSAGRSTEITWDSVGADSRPVIVVIGSAVTDIIAIVEHVPQAGATIQARSIESQFGGKGLNQAVAASRLGMEVYLIASVADDERGRALVNYLQEEGVRTDLMKVVPNAATPLTIVISLTNGSSSTIGYKGESPVQLDVQDIDSESARAVFSRAACVLLTFEPPPGVVEHALQATKGLDRRPRTVLSPSPAYEGVGLAVERLRDVDYLVGNRWELSAMLPTLPDPVQSRSNDAIEVLISRILVLGTGHVCIAEQFGCMLRSANRQIDVPHFPAALLETTGARDAFSAALTYRIVNGSGTIEPADAYWATAAMAATQSFGGVAHSMPFPDGIERALKLSPFGLQEQAQ
jgi:ribokinase